ncbi:hypothetical protein NE237_032402 [Protea cynaroides]|uniref:Uncharacterized protein n=1 Tax=Protea cynaroides TaxID=273540 RepID=A0A9Q0R322_9MAGN|nr:hypothetical protein NE237_032402 [Protea cynaroides]
MIIFGLGIPLLEIVVLVSTLAFISTPIVSRLIVSLTTVPSLMTLIVSRLTVSSTNSGVLFTQNPSPMGVFWVVGALLVGHPDTAISTDQDWSSRFPTLNLFPSTAMAYRLQWMNSSYMVVSIFFAIEKFNFSSCMPIRSAVNSNKGSKFWI